MNVDLNQALEVSKQASEIAAKMLLSHFRTSPEIEIKGHVDYVTDLDKQCEDAIRNELSNFDDAIPFVGEESSYFSVNEDKIEIDLPDTCWIVDPLDGTSNYAHGFSGYCVSIALRLNKELVVSVVNAPSMNETFTAIKNEGAFVCHAGSTPIKMSSIDNDDRFNIIASAAPFRYPSYLDEYIDMSKKLFDNFEDIRRVGSAELDLSWVANGNWAAYLEKFLKPWDSSAGGLLVKESGGVITDWSGNEEDWLINGQILSSASPRLHEKIMNLIK